MRGQDEQQLDVFSYISPEQRVPQDHPLRTLRSMTDEALRELQPRFRRLCASTTFFCLESANSRDLPQQLLPLSPLLESTHDQHSGKPLFRSLERERRSAGIYLLCLGFIISILNPGHVAHDWHAQNKGHLVDL